MKSFGNAVLVVLVTTFLVSCAGAPPLPPDYSYGKDEIHIDLNADPRLNLYEGRAHTLLLCVHQLRDPNAFNRLAGDKNGIYQFLECSQFDSSVTNSKRIIVQPDQKVNYTLDRAEGTKYVAIAAGYYSIRKDDVVNLFEVPIEQSSSGIFGGTRISGPGILNIELYLGPQKLQSAIAQ
jgi:type VI secretion system VasD/TssJ family lipoprotein